MEHYHYNLHVIVMVEKKSRYKKRTHFSFFTVGKMLDVLAQNGLKISEDTFLRLEKKGFFLSKRTPFGWRVYPTKDVPVIVKILKEAYGID